MLHRILFAALLLFAAHSAAAQQVCLTTTGAKIASDPFPLTGTQPTSCTVYKGGISIATGFTVLSSSIPSSNAGTCLPPSPTYLPGPAGSVACNVTIPAQPAGTVTVTMTASAGGVEGPQSAPFTFVSAAAFSPPPAPTNLRVIP
jgi:hypothetical protein